MAQQIRVNVTKLPGSNAKTIYLDQGATVRQALEAAAREGVDTKGDVAVNGEAVSASQLGSRVLAHYDAVTITQSVKGA